MEIMLNELSLTGQFKSSSDFLECLNKKILPIVKLFEELNFKFSKKSSFFDSQITSDSKLIDIIYSKDNEVRKIKSFLTKLSNNPPFWNDSQKHNCNPDTYVFNGSNVCGTSLAEAIQRDKMVLSFGHQNYLNENLVIQKNNTDKTLFNIIDKDAFLEKLYKDKSISPLEFCCFKFKNKNINFEKLEEKYGFNTLNDTQIKSFVHQFKTFSSLAWNDIDTSDGLQYKSYSGNWFAGSVYSDKNIYKFRITEKYRCFGYRDKEIFYILRFEIDHKISDKG